VAANARRPRRLAPGLFASAPVVAACTLIEWALKGQTEGDGYGFPFDRPHLIFAQDPDSRNMIKQIDKYREKLFADPITAQAPFGPVLIQPQRTNNILELFFRSLKRNNRRKTGNASSSRLLRTMLAKTPLVRNLQNAAYVKILLNGKNTLEELFAGIDIDTRRTALREARNSPEKIPAALKPLIAMPDFPEKLVSTVEKAVA
jgi:hypothetical protein